MGNHVLFRQIKNQYDRPIYIPKQYIKADKFYNLIGQQYRSLHTTYMRRGELKAFLGD